MGAYGASNRVNYGPRVIENATKLSEGKAR